MTHADRQDVTPAEAEALRNRIARMHPRLMPPTGPLAQLRALDRAGLIAAQRQAARRGEDTTLMEAERECRNALERIQHAAQARSA